MSNSWNPRVLYLFLTLASFINIFPMLVFPIGGDLRAHLVWMDCFATQFWQGDWYPRWCFNANAGLGYPLFLFYFPLSYFIAALLTPLKYMGISPYTIYVLLCFCATLLTAATTYSWLKDMVKSECAMLAAILFLFAPYRMELLFFRSAYSELWLLALLPLVFKFSRHITRSEGNAVLPLALVFAAMFLTHIPCAVIAAMFSGGYIALMTGMQWRPKYNFAIGMFWGAALSAFYWLPAVYYKQFLAMEHQEKINSTWVNDYLHLRNVFIPPGGIGFDLTVLFLVGFAVVVMKNRSKIIDHFIRNEIATWGILSAIALYLLIPISAPFYLLIGGMSKIVFPWRMQSIFTLGLIYLIAVWMQWLISARRIETWKGDYGMVVMFLWVLGIANGYSDGKEAVEGVQNLVEARAIIAEEYRTQWTDMEHWNSKWILSRYADKLKIEKAHIYSGQGEIEVQYWAWDGISLHTLSSVAMTVRLDHTYFPIWRARDDKGESITLRAEDASGQMLLDVPAGNHYVSLQSDVANGHPWLMTLSEIVSFLALSGVLFFYHKTARMHNISGR